MSATQLIGAWLIALALARVLVGLYEGWAASAGWVRTNVFGRPVPTGGGLVVVLAALLGLASVDVAAGVRAVTLAATPDNARLSVPGADWTLLRAAVGACLIGLVDDLDRGCFRGWRGHLAAVRLRRFTSGHLKLFAIPLWSLAATRWLWPDLAWREWLLRAAIAALAAHSLNLLDTAPGRALAALGLTLGAVWWDAPAALIAWASLLGALAGYGPDDASGRVMLGEAGAAALGLAAGLEVARAAASFPWPALIALLALAVLAEIVSLGRWFARLAGNRR